MEQYSGRIVCKGIGIGEIRVLKQQHIVTERRKVSDPEAEINRYENAKQRAVSQLGALYEKALEEVGSADAMIFDMHALLLQDMEYNGLVHDMIRKESVNAETALMAAAERYMTMLEGTEDETWQARAVDVKDAAGYLIRALSGKEELVSAEAQYEKGEKDSGKALVLAAEDLTPGEFMQLDKRNIAAFVFKELSTYSHVAILAANRGIPVLTGVDIHTCWDGKRAVADAKKGMLLIQPDAGILELYRTEQETEGYQKELLGQLKGMADVTKDGREVKVYANIDSPADIDAVLENDAAGIGLFRSEFMYLEKNSYPKEEELFAVYRSAAQKMSGRRVVIRTLDMGSDKQAAYFEREQEKNPALGCRGIRVSRRHKEVFKTQLRAIYRAAAYGNIAVMFPMIISLEELLWIRTVCEEIKKELTEKHIDHGEVELGIMIETPAAVMISDILAEYADFFSIGTNDLTQYTLAADRQNPQLEEIYDTHHEAILRMIQMVIRNAHQKACKVSLCGEMASDTSMTERLIQMGIDELSVSPDKVLSIRKVIRESVSAESEKKETA